MHHRFKCSNLRERAPQKDCPLATLTRSLPVQEVYCILIANPDRFVNDYENALHKKKTYISSSSQAAYGQGESRMQLASRGFTTPGIYCMERNCKQAHTLTV